MGCQKPPFPIELWECNYDYPEELFDGLPTDRAEARAQKVTRMAKYAVAASINEDYSLHTSGERLIRTATGEAGTFMTAVRKIASGRKELSKGAIEMEALLLGVYDYIFTVSTTRNDRQALRQEEAHHERLQAAAEAIADAYEQSMDESDFVAY